MLNVLQKQGLSNIIAIVTRYFGGIKLGAGGLTRAYSQSVAQAILEAHIIETEPVDLYEIILDYHFTKKFEHLMKMNNIKHRAYARPSHFRQAFCSFESACSNAGAVR